MKKVAKRVRREVGDIVLITLAPGQYTFALVLRNPLFAFFARQYESHHPSDLKTAVQPPSAFKLWVMKYAVTSGRWPVVGRLEKIPDEIDQDPWFIKKVSFSNDILLTKTGAERVVPLSGQADGLEVAAVWDPEHVEDRLRDLFANRPNKWVESLRPTSLP